MFTYELADIMKPKGVTVNCLDPGTVNTKMLIAGVVELLQHNAIHLLCCCSVCCNVPHMSVTPVCCHEVSVWPCKDLLSIRLLSTHWPPCVRVQGAYQCP